MHLPENWYSRIRFRQRLKFRIFNTGDSSQDWYRLDNSSTKVRLSIRLVNALQVHQLRMPARIAFCEVSGIFHAAFFLV